MTGQECVGVSVLQTWRRVACVSWFVYLHISLLVVDGGLSLKGIGRAFVPEIAVDQKGERSAGQEPTPYLALPTQPDIQSESTSLWEGRSHSNWKAFFLHLIDIFTIYLANSLYKSPTQVQTLKRCPLSIPVLQTETYWIKPKPHHMCVIIQSSLMCWTLWLPFEHWPRTQLPNMTSYILLLFNWKNVVWTHPLAKPCWDLNLNQIKPLHFENRYLAVFWDWAI